MFYLELIRPHPNIVFSSGNHTYRPEWKARGETSQHCEGHQWVKATSLKEQEFYGLGRFRAQDRYHHLCRAILWKSNSICSLRANMVELGSVGGVTGKHIFQGIVCLPMSKPEWLLNIRLAGCLPLVEVFKPRSKTIWQDVAKERTQTPGL